MTSTSTVEQTTAGKEPHLDPNLFRIAKANLEDFELYVEFVREYFCKREQLTTGLEVAVEEVIEIFKETCKKWISQEPSVVATYIPTNQLVGVMFVDIIPRGKSSVFDIENIEQCSVNFQRLIRVSNILKKEIDIFEDPNVQKVMEICLTSVHPDFSGNKLTYRLTEESERRAAQLECQLVTTQSTNIITQHIRRKMGYKERFKMDYETLELDGVRVMNMDVLNGSTCSIVFTKYLKI